MVEPEDVVLPEDHSGASLEKEGLGDDAAVDVDKRSRFGNQSYDALVIFEHAVLA